MKHDDGSDGKNELFLDDEVIFWQRKLPKFGSNLRFLEQNSQKKAVRKNFFSTNVAKTVRTMTLKISS